MKKAAIVFASHHHQNTRKLVEAIAESCDAVLIDAARQQFADLTEFDLIGFASGIDFGKFYDPVVCFLRNNLPEGKAVFFLYTCARESDRFTGTIREAAGRKGAVQLGEYGCKGYNTYGPWKLIGGMNKGHPNREEVAGAVNFVAELMETVG
ncbi:MAG: flavodoxin [Oscillospiraceae bacterium]|nr:flavodoxin [Oscillospiraceae bacterium]